MFGVSSQRTRLVGEAPRQHRIRVIESHGRNGAGIVREDQAVFRRADGHLPHLHHAVSAPRGDAFAVGAEAHAPLTLPVCPLRVRVSCPRGRVPHLHRLVSAPRNDAFAVGAEAHAGDPVGVSLEGEGVLPHDRAVHSRIV